mmetsp:Transcript_24167/g.38973  ORF Transcript_24167/g.38973 Transcript_24167/m.38973 type:complete len:150 (-) Transcript_24167:31-480(-)
MSYLPSNLRERDGGTLLCRFPKGPTGMQLSGTIVKKVLPGSAADQFGIQPGWRFVSIGGFTVPQSNNEDDKEFVYGMIDKALSSEDGMVIEFKIPSESRPTSSTASTSLQRPLSSSGSQLKPQTDNSRRRCRPAFHQSLRIMQKKNEQQ